MLGMVTVMYRSPSWLVSIWVRQLELATFWAASWPVAMKMAVTTLEALDVENTLTPRQEKREKKDLGLPVR